MCDNQPATKKPRTGTMKIGTHNGHFHCDEILACFMLRQLPKYADAEIVRYQYITFRRLDGIEHKKSNEM